MNHLSLHRYSNKKWLGFVLFLSWGINLFIAFLNPYPCRDVVLRYAPMAEQFAVGCWQEAFHPRFGLLFSSLAGSIVWLTGLDGFRSCQIVAVCFFTLAGVPLYGILVRVWNHLTARYGVVLYLVCSHLLRYVFDGLRDSGKILGWSLAVYGVILIFQERQRLTGYFWFSLGCALMTLIKGDGALIALFLFLFVFLLDMKGNRFFPWRSLVAGVFCLCLISPQLAYCYYYLGYPVPECRHALILKRMGIPSLKMPVVELP